MVMIFHADMRDSKLVPVIPSKSISSPNVLRSHHCQHFKLSQTINLSQQSSKFQEIRSCLRALYFPSIRLAIATLRISLDILNLEDLSSVSHLMLYNFDLSSPWLLLQTFSNSQESLLTTHTPVNFEFQQRSAIKMVSNEDASSAKTSTTRTSKSAKRPLDSTPKETNSKRVKQAINRHKCSEDTFIETFGDNEASPAESIQDEEFALAGTPTPTRKTIVKSATTKKATIKPAPANPAPIIPVTPRPTPSTRAFALITPESTPPAETANSNQTYPIAYAVTPFTEKDMRRSRINYNLSFHSSSSHTTPAFLPHWGNFHNPSMDWIAIPLANLTHVFYPHDDAEVDTRVVLVRRPNEPLGVDFRGVGVTRMFVEHVRREAEEGGFKVTFSAQG
jgi:hypothetical protein